MSEGERGIEKEVEREKDRKTDIEKEREVKRYNRDKQIESE